MKRRDILKTTAIFTGYALSAGTIAAVMNGCKADPIETWKPLFFTGDQNSLIAEVAERIIPKTDTPGAKDALVHRYIDEAVRSNFEAEDQEKFKLGLNMFNSIAQEKHGKSFAEIDDTQKDAVLQMMADDHKKNPEEEHIFTAMRQLVVAGFVSSEVGATQFLKYDPIPTEWIGCYDYDKVGAAWAL